MQTPRASILLSALAGIILTSPSFAETVKLKNGDTELTAELTRTETFTTGPVVLMTHGTLAHSKMEIMATLQELLADNEISSLSINLGLGISNRSGMYDCPTPHNHKHEDAAKEIGLWRDFLKSQGASKIVALGHSRGGNQTAQFVASAKASDITHSILIAPMTWNAQDEHSSYKEKYKTELQPILNKAAKLVEQGKGDTVVPYVDFIYCEDTSATAASIASYYKDEANKDTPTVLKTTNTPTLVIIGSEDKIVADLPKAMEAFEDSKTISSVTIDGSDHFFRDLYADEVVEAIVEFISDE